MKAEQPDLFKISEVVLARHAKLGYEKLAREERVFVCIWGLESEVNNGGFNQYYFNSSGDHALDAVDSLRAIEANHTADLVKQANALFDAPPSANRAARQKQLDALGDAKTQKMNELEQEFLKYKDNLEQLLKAYVSKNAEAFRTK